MSKIFKYIKKNYVFLCENMYLPKSPSPNDHIRNEDIHEAMKIPAITENIETNLSNWPLRMPNY